MVAPLDLICLSDVSRKEVLLSITLHQWNHSWQTAIRAFLVNRQSALLFPLPIGIVHFD